MLLNPKNRASPQYKHSAVIELPLCFADEIPDNADRPRDEEPGFNKEIPQRIFERVVIDI